MRAFGRGLLIAAACGLTAPAAAQQVDLTGFYGGVFAGYGIGDDPATSRTVSSALPPITSNGFTLVDVFISDSESTSAIGSALGGLRAGYNHQFGGLVIGAEVSLQAAAFEREWLLASDGRGVYEGTAIATTYSTDQRDSFSSRGLLAFEGRVGWSLENVLLYGRAGVVVAHATVSGSRMFETENLQGFDDGLHQSGASRTSLISGVTVGGGVEAFVAENVSVTAEYGFIGLNVPQLDIPSPVMGGGTLIFNPGLIGIHTIKAGVNHHF